jgi:hypothetical protein
MILNAAEYIIATWNTLHRYHEERYVPESTILNSYPNEGDRIADQIQYIKEITANNVIICLQEVPGDLLESLEQKFSRTHYIVNYQHNRIPKPVKDDDGGQYRDPREYLVTLVPKSMVVGGNISTAISQFKNPGKALLALLFDKFIIINCHISAFKQGEDDLIEKTYNSFIRKYIKDGEITNIILCGDFNKTISDTLIVLDKGNIFKKLSCFVDLNLLRPYTIPSRDKSVDNIIGFGNIKFYDPMVIDVNNTSDHNIVITKFSTDAKDIGGYCQQAKIKYEKILGKFNSTSR